MSKGGDTRDIGKIYNIIKFNNTKLAPNISRVWSFLMKKITEVLIEQDSKNMSILQ